MISPHLKTLKSDCSTFHSPSEFQDATLTCTLTTHDIRDATQIPNFFALSYTWGAPHLDINRIRRQASTGSSQIICNGKSMEITDNLYEFLHHCAEDQDNSLRGLAWVDALCINQHNLPERSHQVNLMGKIYMAATRVIVWLGVEDVSTEAAFQLMKGLHLYPGEERAKLSSHHVIAGHADALLDMGNWKALVCLFQREWFNRAWIIQEVVFAKTALVLCGRHSIHWEYLIEVSGFLATTSWAGFLDNRAIFPSTDAVAEPRYKIPAKLAAAKRTWTAKTDEGLLYALIRARHASCQNPRDKVYSQLAIGTADIFPEYDLSVADVYTNAAKYILNHSTSLLLLTCVEGKEFQAQPGLPSWVPDWTETRFLGLRITGYRHFTAAGEHPQSFALSMDGEKTHSHY